MCQKIFMRWVVRLTGVNSKSSTSHVPILDPLRGIATFAVCLFHFSRGNTGFLEPNDPVAVIGTFGWLGVEAFFVISGFVIPYSLYLRSYTLRDSGKFLIRRLKRLEPPYFASIILIILLHYLSMQAPSFRGGPLDISLPRLVAHVAYLNAILDYDWLSPVFWTLAIEFQYYIFIAIAFPLFNHKITYIRYLSVLIVALLGFAGLGNSSLLPYWLPLFAIGIVAFQLYIGIIPVFIFLAILMIIVFLSHTIIGLQQTVAGLLTAGIILFAKDKQIPKLFIPLSFLGMISYSLYLVHVPIGGRIINLAGRLPESIEYRYPAIVVAFIVSIFGAYLFWRIVELPSQRWSKGTGCPN
jgi:peptidoglycan/LPS O-acetylase OafA/YrhL